MTNKCVVCGAFQAELCPNCADEPAKALRQRLEAVEKALRRAEQATRNAALGFAAGDARTILLNEASNCAVALAGEEK